MFYSWRLCSTSSTMPPSEYTFEIMERELTLKITDLNVSGGTATVKTTSAMKFLEGLISDIFKDLFSD